MNKDTKNHKILKWFEEGEKIPVHTIFIKEEKREDIRQDWGGTTISQKSYFLYENYE